MFIGEIHDKLLNRLLELRKLDPSFTFWLRKKKDGLENGQWFQGTDKYISVGLVTENSGNLSTKSVALHFDFNHEKIQGYLILENRLKEKSNCFGFFSELAEHMKIAKNDIMWYKSFDSSDGINSIIKDFWKFYPVLIKLIQKHKLENKLVISEEQFIKSLEKVNFYRNRLNTNHIAKNINHHMSTTPLNQILYGPPGTGKTYSTIDKVVEICDADYQEGNHVHNKSIYDRLVKEGRVVFTTFHQSMAYEDFIEGIKPVTVDSKIQYYIQDGIFKKLCESATDSIKEFIVERKKSILSTPTLSFEQKYKLFVQAIQQGKINVTTKTGIAVQLTHVSGNGNMRLTTGASALGYIISSNRLKKLVANIPNPSSLQNIHDEIREVIGGANTSLYYAALAAFSEFNTTLTNEIDEVGTDVSVSDILLPKEDISEIPKYVIVIDEINRGNVSAIFGELITLIEEDKRLFAENALSIDLVYSKGEPEKFIVPPNLYILGTMNTADRSVEALDTALRRRFSFTEMLPQPELLSPSAMLTRLMWRYEKVGWEDAEYLDKENSLRSFLGQTDEEQWKERVDIWDTKMKGKDSAVLDHFKHFNFNGYNLEKLLRTINERIEVLVDRDHTIGHAFFMNVNSIEDLRSTFAKNIIPLLQEYFYGNYEKMEMVIGPWFFEPYSQKKNITEIFAVANQNFDLPERQLKLTNVATMELQKFQNALKRLLDINYKIPELEPIESNE